MVFSSQLFLTIFLTLTVGLYYVVPARLKNVLLLVASFLFYAWGEPSHILLMIVTTGYTWGLSLLLERAAERGRTGLARGLLILCLIFSLGTLAYYKYFGFLLENLPFLPLGVQAPALPIGISFYTFQALSYVIDVYRGKVRAQKSWVKFAMYIALFPQLIAGPIVRYTDIEDQLDRRVCTTENLYQGVVRFTLGLGKKVLLANQMGEIWDTISGAPQTSAAQAWLGAAAFALHIFFDFSAYSDMAIGLGKMFGFRFPENFLRPYSARSITEFWRRWHVTLGAWFREYVYIPLGGNRRGTGRTILNLLIVWSLTGLWHGAAWQFVLWGLYYFLFLTGEKFLYGKYLDRAPAVVRHGYTLLIVVVGWVMFACDSLPMAGRYYQAMLGIGVPLLDEGALFLVVNYAVLWLVCLVALTTLPRRAVNWLGGRVGAVGMEWITYGVCALLLLASLSFLASDAYNPFLYFRF